ncbi:hypothetical protein BJY00DRAFT_319300 [Aspergillus carlsbadensis]|nr:hypothetical protein BJY00DRAFT_319300 [Aspergillus carlsbadensis]
MTQPTQPSIKTIAFLGASGGCGHATLVAALSAGHRCLALCRDPSKLHPLHSSYPDTLILRPGNAHNIHDVMRILTHDERHLVDAVNFTIGNKPDLKAAARGEQGDPNVCEKGMETLLAALGVLRIEWGVQGSPLLCVVSTTGISDKRDIPLVFYPLYHFLLAVPHRHKRAMEGRIVAGRERFVRVRPSLLWDGAGGGEGRGGL